jgi:hypothetical protein
LPVITDPERSQTRLTTLRRKHLEGSYIEKSEVKEFVLGLALDFRAELLALPGMIRRAVQESAIKSPFAVEDAAEKAVDAWLTEFSQRPIP